MIRYLLLVLLFTATPAAAEIIRLDCPSHMSPVLEADHEWILDLSNRKATLIEGRALV